MDDDPFSLGVTGTLGVYSMLPLYLVKEHGMMQAQANTLISFSRVLTIPMALIAGYLTDRIGVKRTLSGVLFLTGIATLLIGILTGWPMKMVIFCQPLLAVCFFPPAFAALSQICKPEIRNIAISFTIYYSHCFFNGRWDDSKFYRYVRKAGIFPGRIYIFWRINFYRCNNSIIFKIVQRAINIKTKFYH